MLSRVLSLCVLLAPVSAFGQLLFSEYVEGGGNNKAVEIFNAGSQGQDLSACQVLIYSNGSNSVTHTLNLNTVTLAAQAVYVQAYNQADSAILNVADQTVNNTFSGDDAISLVCSGQVQDVIGVIGSQQEWGSGDISTQNNTIRRLPSVCQGDVDGFDLPNDLSAEWAGFAQDTFDGLGSHTHQCGVSGPEVVGISRLTPANEFVQSAQVEFQITFSETVTGLAVNNFSVDATDAQTSASVVTVSGSGDQWQVLVGTQAGDGRLSIDLDQNLSQVQNAGLEPLAQPFTQGESYQLDYTAPSIVSVEANTYGPIAASEISFIVTFSEDITGFNSGEGDYQLAHSGITLGYVTAPQALTASSYQITVGGISLNGTLALTVNAASVQDAVNQNNGDTLTSATVHIDQSVVPDTPDGLMFSEIVSLPTGAEFIEIYNSSAQPIALDDVYLTDATFSNGSVYYYNIVTGADYGGGGFDDFHARFPAGSTIGPGEYQTVALQGSTAFQTAYGSLPDYELYEDDGSSDAIPDMLEAVPGSINAQGALSDGQNNGEVAVLYHWDGTSDLVQDLDYLLWGDKVEAVSKTGLSIDGPDADLIPASYFTDTETFQQKVIRTSSHADGLSWQRTDIQEGNEIKIGGNGISGHDETSEDFYMSWGEGQPSPGLATANTVFAFGPNLVINEVDAQSTNAESIEIFDLGSGHTPLGGLVLVFYDGASDSVYYSVDLDGISTDAGGYALIGSAGLSPDLALPTDTLLDTTAAVALYIGNATDFPGAAPVTTDGLIDAMVYGDVQDAGLLALLNNGQAVVSEGATPEDHSLQRCPNGSGGTRNTASYQPTDPTPGLSNSLCPVGDYYASANPSSAAALRASLHEIIDDHQRFPYTSSSTDTWDILELADEDPTNSNAAWMVYRNNSYNKFGGGIGPYNREHSWPKSLGFPNDSDNNYPYTDTHHLMLSDVGYNSSRGNKYFDYCASACDEISTDAQHGVGGSSSGYPGNSNWTNNSVFEVWQFRKGDLARAMFYMDVRYEGGTHGTTGATEPDLVLTDNVSLIQGTDGGTAYMGLLSVLLEWHALDPVDDIERQRNEVIFGYQGNRNPFVDHPDWAACIFEDSCSVAGTDVIFSSDFE